MAISDKNLTQKKSESKSIQHDSKQKVDAATLQLEDNRPEAITQLKWKEALSQQQLMENSASVFSDQRSSTTQLQALTAGQSSEKSYEHSTPIAQRKSNQTGLPDSLKSGVEQLSGQSLDDVHVHTNSDKPSQLNAHAYAQGADIHIAPGQEKHLPHEAWHVAQQKQGRVKPTKQLKGKTNINDDEGLEREADVMGARAASLEEEVAQPKSINPVATPSIQFNKTEGSDAPVADAGSAYSFTEPGFVFEKSQMRSLAAVSKIKQGREDEAAKAEIIKNGKLGLFGGSFLVPGELDPKKLGFLIPVKIDVSADKQIGTWSPTQVNFNYTPLVASKEDAKLKAANPGETGYLDSKKVIKSKVNLLKNDGTNLADSKNAVAEKAGTLGGKIANFALNNSRKVRTLVNTGAEKGADALNNGIDWVIEHAGKQVPALANIQFGLDTQATKVTPLGTYISVFGGYHFGLGREFKFVSTFKLNSHTDYSADYFGTSVTVPPIQLGDPQTAELKLNVNEFIHDPGNKGTILTSNNGSAALSVLGQQATASWNSMEFDSSQKTNALKVKWGTVGMDLDMLGNKMNFNIEGPDIVDGKFTFTKASGQIDSLSPFNGVNFKKVNAKISSAGGSYDVRGEADFEVQNLSGVESASGKVAISRASDGTMQYALEGGNLTAKILGQTVTVNGVSYDSAIDPALISADAASLKVDVLGTNLTLGMTQIKIDRRGFSFETAQATIPELALTDGIKAQNILLDLSKIEDNYVLAGVSDFVAGGTLEGLTIATTGKINVTKNGDQQASAQLLNTNIELTSGDQYFKLLNASYANKVFKAGSVEASMAIPFIESRLPIEVKNLEISGSGYSISEASIKPNASIDFGFASASVTELKVEKNDIGTKVSGSGGISIGGGTILDKSIPQITGIGTVSHQFKKDGSAGTTEKDLVGVQSKLPAFDLPKDMLPSGLWPVGVSFPIPVAPAVQVKIFAGVKGGISSNDTSISFTKKDAETYTLSAESKGLALSLEANLGAGVEAGSPFIASVMVGLEAAGIISAEADIAFSKDFSIAGPKTDINIAKTDTSSFTYTVGGGVDLAANLVFEATALYFLSKKWTKQIAKKNLGSFKKENGGAWEFKGPEKPLQSDEDLMNDVSSNLPKSLKGKSKEELDALGQQKRFTSEAAGDVVSIYNETSNTEANPARLIDWGTFNYNRIEWNKLQSLLPIIIENSDETQEQVEAATPPLSVAAPETAAEERDASAPPSWFEKFKENALVAGAAVKEEITYSKALEDLGKAINSKEAFISAYEKSANDLTKILGRTDRDLKVIIDLHLGLVTIYKQANNQVKRKVHSSILGDKKAQALRQIGRFFGVKGLKEESKRLLDHIPEVKVKHEHVKDLEKAYMIGKGTV